MVWRIFILINNNFIYLDFVHPDDVEKLREQLNLQSQDGSPNSCGRILDLKTGTIKKDGHGGGVRSGKVFCTGLFIS